jgi:hypothetical protein
VTIRGRNCNEGVNRWCRRRWSNWIVALQNGKVGFDVDGFFVEFYNQPV